VVYEGCVASGLFAFAELLQAANKRAGCQKFDVTWCGVDFQPVAITVGSKDTIAKLQIHSTIEHGHYDAVLVPGFWANDQRKAEQQIKSLQPLVSAIKALPQNTDLLGYCTGVALMAASGRLNGCKATATWWLADFVQEFYQNVQWNFSQTCIRDDGQMTAAGLNGYLPLAEVLIEQICGQDILRDIIDLMIIPKPERVAQPFNFLKLIKLEDKLLKEIFVWVQNTPSIGLNNEALAVELKKTERTLARKIKLATGYSLAEFMRLVKMHQASDMLIYTSKPVSEISDQLGFSDDTSFRRTFKKVSTFTPKEYRHTFQR
jgi:transcriptional regulator GlxA family with amidase domain